MRRGEGAVRKGESEEGVHDGQVGHRKEKFNPYLVEEGNAKIVPDSLVASKYAPRNTLKYL